MSAVVSDKVTIEVDGVRTQYGLERLSRVLPQSLRIAIRRDSKLGPEAFTVRTTGDETVITGGDDSGAMYGLLELTKRINEKNLNLDSKPQFTLRGPCIGMQKTYILPGRKVYEYPYTKELFPFFYDRAFWAKYLDFLADNRFNTLYLWSGHPFASLMRLADYPDAVEVSDEQLEQNMAQLRYVADECNRRGIWLVQGFYSLLMPKPLADKHGFDTQLAAPNKIASDYTRKSIAKFIELYPSVGLKVCLGEALHGQENQNYWLLEVVLPGVKDGMAAAGLKEEPPIVVRTHATDLRKVLPHALKIYGNIHTEAKFNGESLTTHEPRGKRQIVHQAMSKLAKSHLINVHILANLEPFRYGSQRFIKKCIQAGRDRLGASGLHLYPLAFWSWPDAPDTAPLQQMDRDWIWFEAWARYAWNPDIDEAEDREYWVGRLEGLYGTRGAAEHILDAYNDAGEVAPRLLRRFGITEGNRQTMALGMTLDQLVNPHRHRAYEELWESQSPAGERLGEYVQREYAGQPHEGETPPQIIAEAVKFADQAVHSADTAAALVKSNKEEFERIRNDCRCIAAMARNFSAKVKAAIHVLRYQLSKDINDMVAAEAHLTDSLEHYRELAKLTKDTYRFANTMQTNQRKVPFNGGVDNKPVNYHWTQCLPLYEQELTDFRHQVADLKSGKATTAMVEPLPAAKVTVLVGEPLPLREYERVFTDRPWQIKALATELTNLKGVRVTHEKTPKVEFESAGPVQVLIGYVKSKDPQWLKVPDLETDAAAADQGGLDPLIQNGIAVDGMPPIDVHALQYPAGKHTLTMRGDGSFLVLGFVPAGTKIRERDARLGTR